MLGKRMILEPHCFSFLVLPVTSWGSLGELVNFPVSRVSHLSHVIVSVKNPVGALGWLSQRNMQTLYVGVIILSPTFGVQPT